MKPTPSRYALAASALLAAHQKRERFAPLPPGLAPETPEEAYLIQDDFVALLSAKRGAILGYKVALSTAEMRKFVGVDEPQAGVMLERTLRRSPCTLRAADYVNLIVEFEIGVEIGTGLPAADAPFSRQRITDAIAAVMPAIEVADDRNADYAALPKHPLALIADNAWNEGAVLGVPLQDWERINLAAVQGVASINGVEVGRGIGAHAMGHPLDAVAWLANNLASRGRSLIRGDVVITGSLVTTKQAKAGDLIRWSLEGLGDVELRVD